MQEKKYNVESFNLDHTKVVAPFVRLASKKQGAGSAVNCEWEIGDEQRIFI